MLEMYAMIFCFSCVLFVKVLYGVVMVLVWCWYGVFWPTPAALEAAFSDEKIGSITGTSKD